MLRATGERRATSFADFDGTRASSSTGTLKTFSKVASVAAVTNRIRDPSGREDVAAPARAYFGTSAFDGFPALIVDYRGQRRFGRFRDEVRHVGCGVWLGKTYLMDAEDLLDDDAETLAESLAAVGACGSRPWSPRWSSAPCRSASRARRRRSSWTSRSSRRTSGNRETKPWILFVFFH